MPRLVRGERPWLPSMWLVIYIWFVKHWRSGREECCCCKAKASLSLLLLLPLSHYYYFCCYWITKVIWTQCLHETLKTFRRDFQIQSNLKFIKISTQKCHASHISIASTSYKELFSWILIFSPTKFKRWDRFVDGIWLSFLQPYLS